VLRVYNLYWWFLGFSDQKMLVLFSWLYTWIISNLRSILIIYTFLDLYYNQHSTSSLIVWWCWLFLSVGPINFQWHRVIDWTELSSESVSVILEVLIILKNLISSLMNFFSSSLSLTIVCFLVWICFSRIGILIVREV